MLRQKAVISCVGIEPRETVVIRSMFRLASWLQEEFEIPQVNENREPDVLLVNADDPQALRSWQKIWSANKRLISIMLCSKDIQLENAIAVKRPLTLKKLVTVLKSISTNSQSTKVPILTPINQPVKRYSILVVDDSLPVRKYMDFKIRQLCQASLHIDFAANGKDAMTKLANEVFNMVFLDVVMPGIDGYKICKLIKANYLTKVILLTSKGSPFDRVRGAMSGCDSYLVKPPSDKSINKALLKYLKIKEHV